MDDKWTGQIINAGPEFTKHIAEQTARLLGGGGSYITEGGIRAAVQNALAIAFEVGHYELIGRDGVPVGWRRRE